MSKCKPTQGIKLQELSDKGVSMHDEVIEGTRFVSIKVPYESLRDDKQVQIAFQDLVSIAVLEPAV